MLWICDFYNFNIDVPGKVIARGRSGVIRLVTHIATGRKLVWKQIALIDGEEDGIKEEAKIAKGIHSRYVVEILDSFVDDVYLYLVMEFFEGGTLATIVDDLIKSKKQIPETVFFF
jgi:serine/threonine protein kinase